MPYLFLAAAILAEVIGTTALKLSDGFSRLVPSLVVIVSYGIAFWALSVTLKTLPVGVAYAIWCGAGIVLVAIAGRIMFSERLDWAAFAGMGLVMAGIALLTLVSQSGGH